MSVILGKYRLNRSELQKRANQKAIEQRQLNKKDWDEFQAVLAASRNFLLFLLSPDNYFCFDIFQGW